MKFLGVFTIAEYELPYEAIDFLRGNTVALNEQETSDYVLSIDRETLIGDLAYPDEFEEEILENTPGACIETLPHEVEELLDHIHGLPEGISELRLRVAKSIK